MRPAAQMFKNENYLNSIFWSFIFNNLTNMMKTFLSTPKIQSLKTERFWEIIHFLVATNLWSKLLRHSCFDVSEMFRES